MGEILKAKCKICDYKAEVAYGGGKFDYQTYNPVPCINKTTGEMESVNYKIHKDNPNYIFYTQSELKGDNEGKYIFKNFDLVLNEINNFCPNCKNYNLDFFMYILC
jgi:hypothetical protein